MASPIPTLDERLRQQLFNQQHNQHLYRGNTYYPRMAGLSGYGMNPYMRNQPSFGGMYGGMGGYQSPAGMKGGTFNPYGRSMSPYSSPMDMQNYSNAYMNPFNMGSRSGYNMMGGFGMGMGMSPLQYQPSQRMYPSPFGGPFPLNTFPRNPYNTGSLYGQPMQYAGMFGAQTGYNPYQGRGQRSIVYPPPYNPPTEPAARENTVSEPVPTDTTTTPATTTSATTTPTTVTPPTVDTSNWGNAEWAEWLKNNPIDLSNIYNSIRF